MSELKQRPSCGVRDGNAIKELPKKVMYALDAGYPVYWQWLESEWRSVVSGYALYAQTGHHENGAKIERRLYLTCEWKRAVAVNNLLKKRHKCGKDALDAQLWRLRERDPFRC